MFFMSAFQLHKTVIKQVDKYRKHCLWRGADIIDKRPPKAAWEMVSLPKSEGGLGVLRLQTQNEALLLKNLPLADRKKGSFWWQDILKLLDSYKGLASVTVLDGASCLLWDDLWLHKVPRHHYPQLFSFVKSKGISISAARTADGPADLFHLPLSHMAAQQFLSLAHDLNSLPELHETDVWTYI
jgi:hypothetical protein